MNDLQLVAMELVAITGIALMFLVVLYHMAEQHDD